MNWIAQYKINKEHFPTLNQAQLKSCPYTPTTNAQRRKNDSKCSSCTHTHTHPHTLPDSPPGSPGTGSSLVPISLTPSLIPSFPLAAWDLNGHTAQVRQWLMALQHSPSRTKTILSLLPDIIWLNSFYISTLSQALCQGITFKHGKLSLLKFTSLPKWLSLVGVYGS